MKTFWKILRVLATPLTIVTAAPAALSLAILNTGTWLALHTTAVYKKRWGFTKELVYPPFLKSVHDTVTGWWSPLGKYALGGAVDVAHYTEQTADALADYKVRYPTELESLLQNNIYAENPLVQANNTISSSASHTTLDDGVSVHSETEERERMIALAKAEKKKVEDEKQQTKAKADAEAEEAKAAKIETRRIAEEARAAEEKRQLEKIAIRKKEMEDFAAANKAKREEQAKQKELGLIEAGMEFRRNAESLIPHDIPRTPNPVIANPTTVGTPMAVGGMRR